MTRTIEVSAAILLRETEGTSEYLLAQRPPDKVYAGYWEFPGGKFEPGETVRQALARELHEELGITIDNCLPWHVTTHDYEHAQVRLHWCKVTRWQGQLQMREGQSMAWQQLPLQVQPVLGGAMPALQWLAQERGLAADQPNKGGAWTD